MMTRVSWRAWVVVAALLGVAADWPGWRGPTGMGLSDEKDLPLTWGGKDGENVLWKKPLPGADGKSRLDHNQSSPVVQGGRVFVTVSYWPAGVEQKEYPEHHVACYKADDGAPLWDVTVKPGPWKLSDLRGGYTAPTPAADAERVYVLFGSSVLAALDHDGKPLWRTEITPYAFDVADRLQPGPLQGRGAVAVRPERPALADPGLRPENRRSEMGEETAGVRLRPRHADPGRDRRQGRSFSSPRRAPCKASTRPTARCSGRARPGATPFRRSTRAASSTSTAAAAVPPSPWIRPAKAT